MEGLYCENGVRQPMHSGQRLEKDIAILCTVRADEIFWPKEPMSLGGLGVKLSFKPSLSARYQRERLIG